MLRIALRSHKCFAFALKTPHWGVFLTGSQVIEANSQKLAFDDEPIETC